MAAGAENLAFLQWLRRKALQQTVTSIVKSTGPSHFREHLEALIWPYLKQAVRVPRDAGSITEALARAPAWPPTTILVSAGVYQEHLVIDKPVALLGLGKPQLAAPSAGRPAALLEGGSGELASEVRGFDVCGSDGVSVRSGSPCLRNCNVKVEGGSGLTVLGEAAPLVEGCSFAGSGLACVALHGNAAGEFRRNELAYCAGGVGIVASGSSASLFEENTFTGHRTIAVNLLGASKVLLRGNHFKGNTGSGVLVREQAEPKLEGNDFSGHRMPAVSYQDVAGGEVCSNSFEGNQGIGILACGASCPRIIRNTLLFNGRAPSSSATAATASGGQERAAPGLESEDAIVEGANARSIKRAAIALQGQSKAVVQGNRIERNEGYGILVWEDAEAKVSENWIAEHKRPAVAFRGQASGLFRDNELVCNRYGVAVLDNARPTVRGNRLRLQGVKHIGILVHGASCPSIEENEFTEHTGPKQCISVHSRAKVIVRGNRMGSPSDASLKRQRVNA
eukprot:TRINITY_DN107313_c0_g1_i1.p1 TRINITY_DN107313_c0_g1~~TRINITY_DN107313_c0_g1_i1.p1  ORF type:complete len:508 (-),score=111.00 TRINITY_DN107313_c0_g1_i1:41-1564(-)